MESEDSDEEIAGDTSLHATPAPVLSPDDEYEESVKVRRCIHAHPKA
jgi:hypothetical protein